MPKVYVYRCGHCGHERLRTRRVPGLGKSCPKCGRGFSPLRVIDAPSPDVLAQARRESAPPKQG